MKKINRERESEKERRRKEETSKFIKEIKTERVKYR